MTTPSTPDGTDTATDTDTSEVAGNWADRMADAIAKVLNIVIAAMLFVMCAVTVWQVFARYVLNDASSWSEEVARIMMTYMALLGSAVVIRSGGHVTVTVLIDRVGPRMLKVLLALRDLAMLATLGVVAWTGFQFAALNAVQLSAAMDIPMVYVYAALWLGAGSMLVMLILVRLSRIDTNWTSKADGFE